MRRVFRKTLSGALSYRWCWSPQPGPSYPTPEALVETIRRQGPKESVWNLDFSFLPKRPSTQREDVPDDVLRSCSVALSESALTVKRLSLTINYPEAVEVAIRFLRGAQLPALRTLDLTLHNVAFVQNERMLATLLQSAAGVAGRLAELRVAMITHDIRSGLQWGQQQRVPTALATLLSASALESLSLEHLVMSSASDEETLVLNAAILNSCRGLRQLSLSGSASLLRCDSFLHDTLMGMPRLEVLDLSGICLNDVQIQKLLVSLRASIGGWHNLQQLNLAGCGLSTWALGLMQSDLGDSHPLPSNSSFGLKVLNLSSNGIDDEGAFVLATVCMRCRWIEEIYLRHNRITEKGAAAICSAVREGTELRVLSFHSNLLKDEGLLEVLRHFEGWPKLQRFDVTRCRLTVRCLPSLCIALLSSKALQELVLDRNDLRLLDTSDVTGTTGGGVHLFAFDSMRSGIGSADMKALTSFEVDRRDALEGRQRHKGTGPANEEKKFNSTFIGAAPFERLGSALASCAELRSFSASGCSLTDTAFLSLTAALQRCRLTHLNLSSNPLFTHVEGIEALGRLLHCASEALEVLDVSCTGLGNVGISVLADGLSDSLSEMVGEPPLRSLGALRELRVSHCRIGDDGFGALADVVPFMCSLERLFLDGNQVTSVPVVVSLLGKLSTLPSLVFVGLHGTLSPRSGAEVAVCSEYSLLRRKGITVHV